MRRAFLLACAALCARALRAATTRVHPVSQIRPGPNNSVLATSSTGAVGFMPIGSGLSMAGGTLSATAGGGPNFRDPIAPGGNIDGTNAAFALPEAPNPPASLMLYVNGLLQQQGAANDYTLNGVAITFNAGSIPQPGAALLASYRF